MNAISRPAYLPIVAFGFRGVGQARVPFERHGDFAVIFKADSQEILRETYRLDTLVCIKCQSTDAKPPQKKIDEIL